MIILPGRGFHSRLDGRGFYVIEQDGKIIYFNYQELESLVKDIGDALDVEEQWLKDDPFEALS